MVRKTTIVDLVWRHPANCVRRLPGTGRSFGYYFIWDVLINCYQSHQFEKMIPVGESASEIYYLARSLQDMSAWVFPVGNSCFGNFVAIKKFAEARGISIAEANNIYLHGNKDFRLL